MNMINYFKLLNLPESYKINLDDLEQNYLKMQAKYHPDRLKNSSDGKASAITSFDLNIAYGVLKDDYKRALHLLALHNIDFEHEAKENVPSYLFSEIMQAHEELDDALDLSVIEGLASRYNHEKHQIISKIGAAFAGGDLDTALLLTIKLNYIINLTKRIGGRIKDAIT